MPHLAIAQEIPSGPTHAAFLHCEAILALTDPKEARHNLPDCETREVG